MTTTCEKCQHYSALSGQCRRHPPVPVIIGAGADGQPVVSGMWPAVNAFDWCGDASVIPVDAPAETPPAE